MGIVEMVIANLFTFQLSLGLFRVLRTNMRHLDIAIFAFLFFYVTTLYAFILGLLRLLEPQRIAGISALGVGFLTYCRSKQQAKEAGEKSGSRDGVEAPQSTTFAPATPTLFRPGIRRMLAVVLCVFGAFQLLRILFHIWYLPPYVWDTVVYHLINVAEWTQQHRIHAVTTPVDRVYWPATFEVLQTWFVVFLHHDILVEVPSLLTYLLAAAAAFALARVLGVDELLSAAAALFYVFTPSLAIQATSCNTDLPIASVYLLAIVILLDLWLNGSRANFPLRYQLLLVFMALSMGIGIKPYLVFISPAPLLLLLLAIWRHRLAGDMWRLLRPGHKAPNRKQTLTLVLVAGSLLLGFYWFVRNAIVFSNPFHPTDFRVLGHLVFGTGDAVQFGPGQRGSASLAGMWQNLSSLVTDRIFDQHGPFTSSLSNLSGWGWFSFVCGLSAMGYALVFHRQLRLLILLFLFSLLSLFAFISVDPWFMRFTLWFPVLFALCFVCLVSHLQTRWLQGLLILLAFGCTLCNLIAVLNVGEISIPDFKRMVRLPPLERSTAELTQHYEGAYRETLAYIPKQEVIGYCFPNNGWGYPLYDNDFSRSLVYIPIDDADFVENMKCHAINYLFTERLLPEQEQRLQRAVADGQLVQIRSYLYALK